MSNNILTQNDIQHIDYKDTDLLKQFINPHGRIMGRDKSNLTAKQQRMVETAIKRARFMGLLPYVQK
ncbi:MAG: ribosomal protein [Candidatus Kaiserbacteria bacterium]|nr:ribosomal protein [Candidatus Kaiserbacteria bacterium]